MTKQKKQTDSWKKLYMDCKPKAISVLKRRGAKEKDAKIDPEDIFQEAMLRLWRQAQLRGEIIAQCPFLIGICIHIWLDELRKKGRIDTVSMDKVVTILKEEGYDIEDGHVIRENKRWNLIYKYFVNLPAHCQKILFLSWSFDEETGKYHTNDKIAAILECGADYVRTRKSACRNKLIDLIKYDPNFKNLK